MSTFSLKQHLDLMGREEHVKYLKTHDDKSSSKYLTCQNVYIFFPALFCYKLGGRDSSSEGS